eukprot:gene1883-19806_t
MGYNDDAVLAALRHLPPATRAAAGRAARLRHDTVSTASSAPRPASHVTTPAAPLPPFAHHDARSVATWDDALRQARNLLHQGTGAGC